MKLIYSGFGLESINITFVDSMTYTVSKEQGEYLLSTFPTSFSVVLDNTIEEGVSSTVLDSTISVVSSVILDNTLDDGVSSVVIDGTEDTSKKRKRKIK